MELSFHVEQLLAFALQHAAYGNARPSAHHFGNIVGRDLFLDHGTAALSFCQLLLNVVDVLFKLAQFTVADFGYVLVVAFALGAVGFELQVLDLLLVLLNLVYHGLLALPLCALALLLFAQVADFLAQLLQFTVVAFALDGFAFYLQLPEAAHCFVELFGQGVALHTQLGRGFIHEVNGLVGQETVADISLGQLHGGYHGIVLNPHLVVILVALLQSAQYADAVLRARFVHHHDLEPPLQSLVLFEVFLILVERGGSDGAYLAAAQGWFQYVGSVHGSLALSGTH